MAIIHTDEPMGGRYDIHSGDCSTTLRGVVERLLLDSKFEAPTIPDRDALKLLMKFKRQLCKHISHYSQRISLSQFCDYYTGRKRGIYVHAAQTLEFNQLKYEDSFINAFVKDERYNSEEKSEAVPRVIQPRNPRYAASLGCFIKPQEHLIYLTVNGLFGEETIMKGLNANRRAEVIHAKWSSYTDPVCVGLDASRFDRSVSRQILEFEHSIYLMLFGGNSADRAEFRKLLKWQLRTTGFCRGKRDEWDVKYGFEGGRASGDMNTSLGNCLIMCAMIWTYLDSNKISAKVCNDGDDAILILERADLGRLSSLREEFLRWGFDMKVEAPVDEIEQIEFCQSHPVLVSGKWRMVRDPRTCLTKDLYTSKDISTPESWNKYRGEVGLCGSILSDGVPIMGAFYQMMMRGATVGNIGDVDCGMKYLALGMDNNMIDITDDTRLSFSRAFGIDVEYQLLLEKHYDSISPKFV